MLPMDEERAGHKNGQAKFALLYLRPLLQERIKFLPVASTGRSFYL